MEVEDQQRRQGGAGKNSLGNAREQTIIKTMGKYLKKSEKIQVRISELERFLLSTGEEAINVMSLAKNTRNEWLQVCSDRNEPGHRSGRRSTLG